MNKVNFYECSCGCTIMRVEFDEEIGEFYVSIYELYGNRRSFYNRIRFAIKVLLSGEPYGDQLVLSGEDADRLSKDLKDIIKEKQK